MRVIAVIGDIVGSRRISERMAFQRRLQKAVADTNILSASHTASPYTITLGDEVQAVYENADGLIHHILYLMSGISPISMRFAIGVGSLSTPINTDMAIGMDGPAFHAARDGLERFTSRSSAQTF
jgi:hypothetical protein